MLNPWAALVVVLALLCIIIAWKGTQDNVLSAILGRQYGNGGLSTASGGAVAAPAPDPADTGPLPAGTYLGTYGGNVGNG